MKYIIYWILSYSVQTGCPQSAPLPDEFGRVHVSNVTTTQLCWETKTSDHSKSFTSKDSAYSFYRKAFYESKKKDMFGNSEVQNVRIDSVKLKP